MVASETSYAAYLKKRLIRSLTKNKCEFLFDSYLLTQLKIFNFLTFEFEIRSKQVQSI